jgi:phosphogluconate dehydratase
MSGASGKIPAAIHVTPEAADGGAIAKIHNGDIVRVDATAGTLDIKVDAAELLERKPAKADLDAHHHGLGRELFGLFRRSVGTADTGASVLGGGR